MKDCEKFDNCEVYIGKNALRVVREGYSRSFYKYDERYEVEGTYVPLGIALANFNKPFVTFGLPKKLKKYIEKRAKNVIKPVKSKKGNSTSWFRALRRATGCGFIWQKKT